MRLLSFLLGALFLAAPSLASSHLQTHKKHIRLSSTALSLLEARLAETAVDTWVSGTRAEALLELYYPSLSVFSPAYDSATGTTPKIEEIVGYWEEKRLNESKELAHVDGGAAGDPPSLGLAWLVTAENSDLETKERRWEAATQQLEYLLEDVPRTQDGAISHRPSEEKVQLWNDFVYMVPPFLSYYGIKSHNASLVKEAYEQCRLYRQYLKPEGQGAWRHIMLGDWQDPGLWATGNAWAAAGMTRVLATMQNSQYASQFSNEIHDLESWTREILVASFTTLQPNEFVLNYFDNSTSFTDSASSALLAATTYRLAVLDSGSEYSALLASAATIRDAVYSNIGKSTGWLSGAVNPLAWTEQTNQSPEAQAFVLLLHSAHRDYQATVTVDKRKELKTD